MSIAAGQLRVTRADVRADGSVVDAFTQCADSLYRWFAVRTGNDRALADDLMQQLWVKALQVQRDGGLRTRDEEGDASGLRTRSTESCRTVSKRIADSPSDSEVRRYAECEYWLRRVARNLLVTHWRVVARRPADVPVANAEIAAELATRMATEALPDEVLTRREMREQLLLAITELPHFEQSLIVGHYFEQRPQAELAAMNGKTTRAVEGALYRARGMLRELLTRLVE